MPAVIAIVGGGGAGKTTLIEKLIPVLKKRGFRIGTVKHVPHHPDVDPEGKDSWRHSEAGAETVIVDADDRLIMFKKVVYVPYAERLLKTIGQYFDDLDLVLAEGYKTAEIPKIEVFRESVNGAPVCLDDPHLIAIITDSQLVSTVPSLAMDEIDGLAELIESHLV